MKARTDLVSVPCKCGNNRIYIKKSIKGNNLEKMRMKCPACGRKVEAKAPFCRLKMSFKWNFMR